MKIFICFLFYQCNKQTKINMAEITFTRNLDITLNSDRIPSHIIDALDELFYKREWDFVELVYEGEYDESSDIFHIKSIKDGAGIVIDKETIDYAWEFLHPMFRKYLKY